LRLYFDSDTIRAISVNQSLDHILLIIQNNRSYRNYFAPNFILRYGKMRKLLMFHVVCDFSRDFHKINILLCTLAAILYGARQSLSCGDAWLPLAKVVAVRR
jgi:hypothetical protein